MFMCMLLLIHLCLAFGIRDRHPEEENRDCRVANLPLATNVDFRKYPLFVYHQLSIGNNKNVYGGGVSFITRLTDNTLFTYASGRNSTTLECGSDGFGACRNVPVGSSIVRVTTINIPAKPILLSQDEPFTFSVWLAAADYKDYLMFYLCSTPLDNKGACPPGQSQLYVETTAARLSKRMFNIALSVASRLCIDPNQWLHLRDRPTCPKALALRARHERRMRKMRKQGRGYGHPTW